MIQATIPYTGTSSAQFDHLNALERIWEEGDDTVRQKIWDDQIVPWNLEIAFISQAYSPGSRIKPDDLERVLRDKNRQADLLKKYIDKPEALAVVWSRLNPETMDKLWKKKIVRRNQEIPFLSQVDKPGSFEVLDIYLLLRRKKGEAHLVKKYRNDLNSLAVIWKILIPQTQEDLWDTTIVKQKLEVEFLSRIMLQDPKSKKALNMLFFQDNGRRRIVLMNNYQEDTAKLAVIHQIFKSLKIRTETCF